MIACASEQRSSCIESSPARPSGIKGGPPALGRAQTMVLPRLRTMACYRMLTSRASMRAGPVVSATGGLVAGDAFRITATSSAVAPVPKGPVLKLEPQAPSPAGGGAVFEAPNYFVCDMAATFGRCEAGYLIRCARVSWGSHDDARGLLCADQKWRVVCSLQRHVLRTMSFSGARSAGSHPRCSQGIRERPRCSCAGAGRQSI